MDIRACLPRDKSDFEAVSKLNEFSNEELKGIIPELMEWLQDGNWPISKPVEDLLLRLGEDLIPHVKDVLQTQDPQWEYFILVGLIDRLPISHLSMLQTDLVRILESPTPSEILEDLDEVIVELLEKMEVHQRESSGDGSLDT
ncbi:DUF5071 domain-containing protein [Paenibacillus amylolyticus]|uniref:DUF5071 domain-containing protein n=1 Tax=Paenibacillus amylolyticus TaxID=1451 RepID=UPI00201D74D1|nr:DUF5071 domain-containing protein [Paenibacillus amylolyticus]MCL6661305.1 DUF5071 domain-containing protein [Paenibacillus amylolyticus]